MGKKKGYIFLATLILNFIIFSNAAFASSQRISGDTRCLTAIEISKTGWSNGSSVNVVLATADDYPDALCAAPLAKQLDAPILLVQNSSIDANLSNELTRLGVKNAYIIGGKKVISDSAVSSLTSLGITSTRIFGDNRYETSVEIAKYMTKNTSTVSEVVVATGDDFVDALSIAPIAAVKGMPIILSSLDTISDSAKTFVSGKNVSKTYVIGGIKVVSDNVKNSMPGAQRISGNSRFETNAAVIQAFSSYISFGTTYFATGLDFPDALAGSALAPKTISPIVLTGNNAEQATKSLIASEYPSIWEMRILGGEKAVPASVVDNLTPKIVSVSSLSSTVNAGDSYSLPLTVQAVLDSNTTMQVPVTWNTSTVNTQTPGTYTFTGTVKGYSGNVTLTLNVAAVSSKHPIMGSSQVTAQQMARFLLHYNPSPVINPDPNMAQITAEQFCQLFLDEGAAEGVRGDIAFCQSIKETGYFRFSGMVPASDYNYAGIGATNDAGNRVIAQFQNQRMGIRGQIQHLKAYATKDPIIQPIIDPRYQILVNNNLIGIAPNWEDLDGHWAWPGDGYGESIMDLFDRMKNFTE